MLPTSTSTCTSKMVMGGEYEVLVYVQVIVK